MTAKRPSRSDSLKAGRFTVAELVDARWKWLYKLGGAAASLAGGILLLAMAAFVITPFSEGRFGWLAFFEDLWLIVIFKLHDGLLAPQPDPLYGLNLLDLMVLFLVGGMGLGLYAASPRAGKTWSLLAATLPFLGVFLFLATRLSGRSSMMAAAIVFSLVMLRGSFFNKAIAFFGLLAGGLLLIGDISLAFVSSGFLAVLTAIGYMLMTAWFFAIGRRLLLL